MSAPGPRNPSPAEAAASSARTLTFLFADLAGSTRLVNELGDRYLELLRTYHTVVSRAAAGHVGRVETTRGDTVMCVFSGAWDAVQAAHDILAALAATEWPGGAAPKCRIGIHTGTATTDAGTHEGPDVRRAALIGEAAQAGQVLISETTRLLVEDGLQWESWQAVDLGTFVLSGFDRPESLSRVDFPDVPVVVTPPRARPAIASSVPTPAHGLVGRLTDIEGAAEMLLRDDIRLVTLTGPGGTGKTRLAVELARRLESHFPDGIVFVDLAAVRTRDEFLSAVGRALGIYEGPERGIVEGLASVLGTARLLLILDNMEQIIAAGSELATILERLPSVRALVTSRFPLRISWEHEYPLLPLGVPTDAATQEEIMTSEAVELFAERARSVRPDFELTLDNAPVIAEIARRLDGLPLAIELAAARLRLFSPEMLLARLDDRLALLDRGPQDAPERHRTLRAAIGWSHDLLEDRETVVFRRLGVFAAGWPIEAVGPVCADQSLGEMAVLQALEELVAKSLVVFSVDENGEPRYRMLETLRDFSLERLHESGEEEDLRRRHLAWCHTLATDLEDRVATPEFPLLLDSLDRERYNLRAALGWSSRTGEDVEIALRIAGMLPLYWDTRGYVAEGLDWCHQLLGRAGPGASPGKAMALTTVGWLAMLGGDPDLSVRALAEAVEMWRELGDDRELSRTLAMQGMTTYNLGGHEEAIRQFDEASRLARANGLEWIADAWCPYGLAHIALARGAMDEAATILQQVLDYSRKRGLTWGVGHAQLSLGVLAYMGGDLSQSTDRLSESLLVREQLKDSRGICDCLGMMALLASASGDQHLAATLIGAAEVRREASGHRPVPWQQPLIDQAATAAEQELGDSYPLAVAGGRALPPAVAITTAVERLAALATSKAPGAS